MDRVSTRLCGGTLTISEVQSSGSALGGSRVVVVTGGANGIGEAVVRRFSNSNNMSVVVADRDTVAARTLVSELVEGGASAHAMELDVSSPTSINEFFGCMDAEFGRCDILVNNAGIARIVPFMEVTLEDWNAHLAINVTGALLMAQHAVPFMERSKWGRIVNVSSISGIRASVGRTAYGTSKGALSALTRQMAVELAASSITVNAVAPGPVETPLTRAIHSQEMRHLYHSMVPIGRYATPDEVAASVVFLSSSDATYITGQTLIVDGGFVTSGLLSL